MAARKKSTRKTRSQPTAQTEATGRRLTRVFQDSAEPIVIADRDGAIVDVNADAARDYGWTREELLGRSFKMLLPPEEHQTFDDWMARCLRGEEVRGRELTPVTKDGRWLTVLISLAPLTDDAGKVVGIASILVDITERKRANDEIRRLNEKLEHDHPLVAAILDTAGALVVVLDREGRIIEFNRACRELTSYTLDEVVGQRIWDLLLVPDEIEAVKAVFADLKMGQFPNEHENEWVTKDGTRHSIAWSNTALCGDSGAVQYVIATGIDVTLRKRAEEALRESRDRMRAIVNTAADAIITIGEDGHITIVNPATEKMFGYTADELIGQNVELLMPFPYRDEHDRYLANYHETGETKIIGIGRVVTGRRKDGSIFPIDLAVSKHHDGKQWLFTGIIRDISERKALQNEILNIAAEEDRRIGQDLHDVIGQQLMALGLTANTLRQTLQEQSTAEQVAFATKLTDGLKETLEQVRVLSKGLVPVEVDAEGLMSALAELAATINDLNGITCMFECDRPVLVEETQAATHLYRIAQEAVTNAVKHARTDNIRIGLQEAGELITLTVQDHGIGLPPLDAQLGGIGLKIMRYRADLLGGQLTVGPAAQGGTLVTCVVPQGG